MCVRVHTHTHMYKCVFVYTYMLYTHTHSGSNSGPILIQINIWIQICKSLEMETMFIFELKSVAKSLQYLGNFECSRIQPYMCEALVDGDKCCVQYRWSTKSL